MTPPFPCPHPSLLLCPAPHCPSLPFPAALPPTPNSHLSLPCSSPAHTSSLCPGLLAIGLSCFCGCLFGGPVPFPNNPRCSLTDSGRVLDLPLQLRHLSSAWQQRPLIAGVGLYFSFILLVFPGRQRPRAYYRQCIGKRQHAPHQEPLGYAEDSL